MKLSQLKRGAAGRVHAIVPSAGELEPKLRELGFCEGDEVEMLERGPLGGRTIAVRLNRTIVALRRAEADLIEVESA